MSEIAVAIPHTRVPSARLGTYTKAFAGLLLRDARVLLREFGPFVARTIMNPLAFVFVFAYVFPKIGQGFSGGPGGVTFATILVPGLVGSAMVFQGIMAVALPLVNEFSRTKEIEDRVMAPLPVSFVALEKMTFGALQAMIAAVVVFPLVYTIPATPVSVHVSSWPLLIGVIILSSFVSSALGMAVGTLVKPQQIPLVFSILVIPLTFLGCVYYPWARLAPVKWLQIAVLVNPLVYSNEGLRSALTPGLPHMHAYIFLAALLVAFAALASLGMRAFMKRVIG